MKESVKVAYGRFVRRAVFSTEKRAPIINAIFLALTVAVVLVSFLAFWMA